MIFSMELNLRAFKDLNLKPAGSKVNSDSIKAMKDSLAQFSANYCRGGKPNHLGNNFLCESFSSSVAPFLWQKKCQSSR